MHHIYIPLHSLDIFGILSQKTSQEQAGKPKKNLLEYAHSWKEWRVRPKSVARWVVDIFSPV